MRFYAPAVLAILNACTTRLESTPVVDTSPPIASGLNYRLAAMEYEVTLTRELVGCSGAGASFEPVHELGATAVPRRVAGETYAVDPEALSNWHKTSSFELRWRPDRTLLSVNAAVEDRGPKIIASAASAVGSLAGLLAGVPAGDAGGGAVAPTGDTGGAAAPGAARTEPVCPTALLAQRAEAERVLAERTAELIRLAADLEPLRMAAALGGGLTEEQRSRAERLITEEQKKRTQSVAATTVLTEIRAALTFKQVVTFAPTSGGLSRLFAFPPDGPGRNPGLDWLSRLHSASPTTPASRESATQWAATLPGLAMLATVDPVAAPQAAPLCEGCELEQAQPRNGRLRGLAYREPGLASLRVCGGTDADACRSGAVPLVTGRRDPAPQLGRLWLLPLENGFGENTGIKAEFGEDGQPIWVSYTSSQAAGESVLTAANAVLGEAVSFDSRLQASRAERDAAAAAPLAAIDARIAILEREQTEADLMAQRATQSARLAQAERQAELARLLTEKQIRELQQAEQ